MSTSSIARSTGPESLIEPAHCHTAHFATRWLQPSMAVITAHGELDAANAQQFVDYALRHGNHTDRLVLDLTGVEFFGTATQLGRDPAAADLRPRFGLADLQ